MSRALMRGTSASAMSPATRGASNDDHGSPERRLGVEHGRQRRRSIPDSCHQPRVSDEDLILIDLGYGAEAGRARKPEEADAPMPFATARPHDGDRGNRVLRGLLHRRREPHHGVAGLAMDRDDLDNLWRSARERAGLVERARLCTIASRFRDGGRP